jgi:hypothetical protein
MVSLMTAAGILPLGTVASVLGLQPFLDQQVPHCDHRVVPICRSRRDGCLAGHAAAAPQVV